MNVADLRPAFLARGGLDELRREAAIVGPAKVHPEQHLGPVLRVRPTGSGVNRHDRIPAVVLAAKQGGFLETLELALQGLERDGDLVQLSVVGCQ